MIGKELLFSKIVEIENLLVEIKEIYFENEIKKSNQSNIDPLKTFKSFTVGDTNNMAVAAALAIAEKPGKDGKYPSLYIHGETGLGKTHLLLAISNEISLKHPELKVCFVTTKNFIDEMISLIKQNRFNSFVQKYIHEVDVLLIDDVQELRHKKGTQDQLFYIFNELRDQGKQMIFTASGSPKSLEGISSRIKSRLEWGLVVDIQPPDLKTCVELLRNLAQTQNFPIEDELLYLIAESSDHNPRSLESHLLRIKATSEHLKQKVDKEFLKGQMLLF